tara:strand:- start:5042 stop:5407 length:366 start_codon:yes stop_codon:yes gene_type:complete
MWKKALISIVCLLGVQNMNGQVIVFCSRVNGVNGQLTGVQSADLDEVKQNKTVISFGQEKCTVEDLVSVEWIGEFIKRKHLSEDDFEILMIIPLNDHHVVVAGKTEEIYGYFEIIKPAPEE